MSPRQIAVAAGAAAAIGAATWFGFSAWQSRADTATEKISTNEDNAAARALAKVSAQVRERDGASTRTNPSAAPRMIHASHSLPAALQFESPQDFRLESHWFDPLPPNADGRFPTSSTPLKFDASCASVKETAHTTLEAAVLREAGFDPAQAAPMDVLVQDIAQFWKLGDTYYKLAGRWERDQPPTYRVHLFSAKNAAFAEPLRVMPLPEGLAPQTDLPTLSAALDREVTRAVEAGGARGARLTQVFYPNAKGNETHEVQLHNGRPVSWAFGHGRCLRRQQGDAYCRCIANPSREGDHAGHNHNTKEEHRVKD
jgi:hypothetical protein